MTVEYRTFRVGDGQGLADAWTTAAPADPITRRRFRELFLLDRNFDRTGMFVATDGGRIVGSVHAVRRRVAEVGDDRGSGGTGIDDTGWIPYVFVVPSHRRRRVATTLCTMAIAWLREHGASTAVFSASIPNYFLPGLDADRYPGAAALLRGLGFVAADQVVAMDADLTGYAMPDRVRDRVGDLRAAGFRLGTPDPDDVVDLVEVAGSVFSADWGRAIREAVLAGLDPEQIQIARGPDRVLLGWAMHGTYERVVERFGPFGVVPASRGLGLGEVLLHLTLQRMRACGAHHAWFLWTDADSPAARLYRKAGFRPTRTFTIWRAPLRP